MPQRKTRNPLIASSLPLSSSSDHQMPIAKRDLRLSRLINRLSKFEGLIIDYLTATLDLFPETRIVGDEWNWEGVRRAVETIASQRKLHVEVFGAAWRISKKPPY